MSFPLNSMVNLNFKEYPPTPTDPAKIEIFPQSIQEIDFFLLLAKQCYLSEKEEHFEETFRIEVSDNIISEGTSHSRKNMRCPFSFCRSNHIGIKSITAHFVSSNSDFPIHYFFRLGQSQTNLKERVKEFFSSDELQSYRKPFGKEGKAIKGGNRKFIGLCRPIGEKINCPAFYTFESLYKNSILIVSFSLVHNHHKPIKQRLPHELAQIAKKFVLNEITGDEALQIDPNTRVINLKLVDQLISLAPEKELLIRSVVNNSFTNSIIKNNRRQSEKQSLFHLFMVPFQKLKDPTFQLPYAKDVEIFLEPQILSETSGRNGPRRLHKRGLS